MSKKGITGHDEWVVTQALATALVALEQLPEKMRPLPHMEDIRKLLIAGCAPGSESLHLAQARCRLLPEAAPAAIYRAYGVAGGRASRPTARQRGSGTTLSLRVFCTHGG